VRLLMLATAVTSLFSSSYITLMPLFTRDVYHWEEAGLSLMMGAAGAGALFGALVVAYLGDFRRKGIFVLGAAFAGAVCLIGFSLVSQPALALALIFGVGVAMVGFFSITNTLLQQLVEDKMRGRVMSIWIFSFIGAMPVGNFLSGLAAERFGVRSTLAAGGLVIALFVIAVGLGNSRLRKV
jgi:MFS family permease